MSARGLRPLDKGNQFRVMGDKRRGSVNRLAGNQRPDFKPIHKRFAEMMIVRNDVCVVCMTADLANAAEPWIEFIG